jgi:hypothetical protein
VFDVGCRILLTYDAYSETIEEKEQQDSEIHNIKQEMIMMQESHPPDSSRDVWKQGNVLMYVLPQ